MNFTLKTWHSYTTPTLNESNSTKEIYIVVQQKILWFVSFNSSPIRSILNQHESILRLISKQSLPV